MFLRTLSSTTTKALTLTNWNIPKKCPKQHYEFEVVCVGIENSQVLKKIKQIQMCSNILHTQTKRSIDLTCV